MVFFYTVILFYFWAKRIVQNPALKKEILLYKKKEKEILLINFQNVIFHVQRFGMTFTIWKIKESVIYIFILVSLLDFHMQFFFCLLVELPFSAELLDCQTKLNLVNKEQVNHDSTRSHTFSVKKKKKGSLDYSVY